MLVFYTNSARPHVKLFDNLFYNNHIHPWSSQQTNVKGIGVASTCTLTAIGNDFYDNQGWMLSGYAGLGRFIVENNYYGHPSGPYHPVEHTEGRGDSLAGLLDLPPYSIRPHWDTGISLDEVIVPFDTTMTGDTSVRSLWLRNDTDSLILLQEMRLDSLSFSFASPPGLTLTPRDSVEIPLLFHPSDAGYTMTTLHIFLPDTLQPPVRAMLTGTAVENTIGETHPDRSFHDGELPEIFELHTPSPNPFNSIANVRVDLPRAGRLTVEVIDVLGRRLDVMLEDQFFLAGRHTLSLDFRSRPSGIYFVRAMVPGKLDRTRKMVHLK
jgi:hypothetical protein